MSKIKLTQNGEWTLNDLVTILQFVFLIGGIIWTVALLPQRVISECNTRYATKQRVDDLREDVQYIRGRVDRIGEVLRIR